VNVEIRDKHHLVLLCENNVTFERLIMKNFGQFSRNLRIRIRFRSICCLPRNDWPIRLLPYADLVHFRIAYPEPVHAFLALSGSGSLGNCVSGPGPFVSCFIRIWFTWELRIRTRSIRLFPYQDPIPSFDAGSGSSPFVYSRVRVRFIRLLPYKPPVRTYPDKVYILLWLNFVTLNSVANNSRSAALPLPAVSYKD
jgi:hypothetical protein